MGAGNELEPKTTPPMTRTTRRTSRLAAYVLPEVYDPPSDDVLGPEGSSRACRRQHSCCTIQESRQHGYSQDCQAAPCTREYVSRYACRRTENPVGRLRGPLTSGCSTSPDSQVGWIQLMTRTSPYDTRRVRRGRGPVPICDHGAAPTSPSGGVLQQLGLLLRGVWALTSSELPWAVPDGPT